LAGVEVFSLADRRRLMPTALAVATILAAIVVLVFAALLALALFRGSEQARWVNKQPSPVQRRAARLVRRGELPADEPERAAVLGMARQQAAMGTPFVAMMLAIGVMQLLLLMSLRPTAWAWLYATAAVAAVAVAALWVWQRRGARAVLAAADATRRPPGPMQ
jgi:membrane protein YdbS with pleckstrin-like domain